MGFSEIPDVIINDKAHSITFSESFSESMDISDFEYSKINQTGKKLKFYNNDEDSSFADMEFILFKQ